MKPGLLEPSNVNYVGSVMVNNILDMCVEFCFGKQNFAGELGGNTLEVLLKPTRAIFAPQHAQGRTKDGKV